MLDPDLVLSANAIQDSDQAVDYYNALSQGLGFEFADSLPEHLDNHSLFTTFDPSINTLEYEAGTRRPAARRQEEQRDFPIGAR